MEVTAGGGITIEAVGNTVSPGFSFAKSGVLPKQGEAEDKISSITLNKLAGKMGGRSVGFGKRFDEESRRDSEAAFLEKKVVAAADVYL